MKVSKSNELPSTTVSVIGGNPLIDESVLIDGDFSSRYTSTITGSIEFEFENLNGFTIDHVAIGGSNFAKKPLTEVFTITIEFFTYVPVGSDSYVTSDGNTYKTADTLQTADKVGEFIGSESNEKTTFVIEFSQRMVDKVSVKVTGSGQASVSDIAAGVFFEIPRGQQAGYNQPWTVPNFESRTAQSLDNAPTALLYQSRQLKCSLSIPNNIMADFPAYYEFLSYAAVNVFYVLEDDDPTHSYAGFNMMIDMTKNHSQTRALGVSSYTFNAHAKTGEFL